MTPETTSKMVPTWRGKRLEDCTREELVLWIHYLTDRLEQEQRWAAENLEMEELFRDTARKLCPNHS